MKDVFAREDISHAANARKFWNSPKSNVFIFGPVPISKSITCFFLEMPHSFMFEYFKMPNFFIILIRLGRWGISRFANIKKWGHSRKKHSIDFEMGKGSKLNWFYYGAFQDFRAYAAYDMPSSAKNPSHAIWGISRNRYDIFKPTHHSVGLLHFQQWFDIVFIIFLVNWQRNDQWDFTQIKFVKPQSF